MSVLVDDEKNLYRNVVEDFEHAKHVQIFPSKPVPKSKNGKNNDSKPKPQEHISEKLLLLVKKILEKFLFIGEMTHIGIKRKIFELFNVLRNGDSLTSPPNYRLKKLLNELEIVCFVSENFEELRFCVLFRKILKNWKKWKL